jgi:thiol-disulfide isomerase/thioredoxin
MKMKIYIIVSIVAVVYGIIYYFLSPKNRLFARILLYPFLLEVAVSPIRGYVSFNLSTLVGFFVFLFLSYYLIKKKEENVSPAKILFTLIIGFVITNNMRFWEFKETLISLPDALFHLLGIVVGYLLFKIKNYTKWVVLATATIACVFMYAKGYDLWLNKLNFGTFTEQIIKEKITTEIAFTDSTNSVININHLKGKIVLLDFWNSKCGFCYKKFPVVQEAYNKYKHNSKVSFYSINFFLKDIDKEGDAFRIIKDRRHSFPVLICKDKATLKILNVTCYPTVLVINPKGELVFRGDIEDADKKIEELLKDGN